jgi:hypothetical protein
LVPDSVSDSDLAVLRKHPGLLAPGVHEEVENRYRQGADKKKLRKIEDLLKSLYGENASYADIMWMFRHNVAHIDPIHFDALFTAMFGKYADGSEDTSTFKTDVQYLVNLAEGKTKAPVPAAAKVRQAFLSFLSGAMSTFHGQVQKMVITILVNDQVSFDTQMWDDECMFTLMQVMQKKSCHAIKAIDTASMKRAHGRVPTLALFATSKALITCWAELNTKYQKLDAAAAEAEASDREDLSSDNDEVVDLDLNNPDQGDLMQLATEAVAAEAVAAEAAAEQESPMKRPHPDNVGSDDEPDMKRARPDSSDGKQIPLDRDGKRINLFKN